MLPFFIAAIKLLRTRDGWYLLVTTTTTTTAATTKQQQNQLQQQQTHGYLHQVS